MKITINCLTRDDRLIWVRVSYGGEVVYGYFNASHGQQKYSHVRIISNAITVIVWMVRGFANGYQQIETQIPIALLPGITVAINPRGFLHRAL